MFGGLGFMERGNMVTGIMGDAMDDDSSIVVRCRPEDTPKLLKEEGVKPFVHSGRAMKGWALVTAEAVADDDQLREWVERSRTYVATLPAK